MVIRSFLSVRLIEEQQLMSPLFWSLLAENTCTLAPASQPLKLFSLSLSLSLSLGACAFASSYASRFRWSQRLAFEPWSRAPEIDSP